MRSYTRPGEHLADHLVLLRHWLGAVAGDRGPRSPWSTDAAAARWTAVSAADEWTRLRCAASPVAMVPLSAVQQRFDLSPTEVRALVLLTGLETSLAVRRDARNLAGAGASERRLPDVGLVAELLYVTPSEVARVPEELGPDGKLARNALIAIDESLDVPFVLRGVRVDQRIAAMLQGRAVSDRVLAPFVVRAATVERDDLVIAAALFEEVRGLVGAVLAGPDAPAPILTGPRGTGRLATLTAAAAAHGRSVLRVDIAGLPHDRVALRDIGRRLRREAALADALIVLAGAERFASATDVPIDLALFGDEAPPLAATCARLQGRAPLLSRGSVLVTVDIPGELAREEIWRRHLPPTAPAALARWAAERYHVGPGVIRAAAASAGGRAQARAGAAGPIDLVAPDLHEGLRSVLDAKLSTLGTRITWRQTWDDLVLPDDAVDDIVEFIARVRHRRQVYETWGMGRKVAKGMGLSALFSGPPGTGKTMVAGLIAQELGLDLYQIDLSKVVSKWIGETEKNLGELFDAAEAGHALLLFDEADSLFAKRTQVNTSNDRYANLEVNYLLQRLEAFTGIVILTTNHDTTIDDAFRRRLSLRIEFAMPAPPERERIWRAILTEGPALAPDLDLPSLAHRFEMSGGYIRNAALRAAFLAANDGTPISMSHLLRAARAEYQAMGKVVAHL
jgi:ATP-dependent 26S proteasome regulatory subunit